MIVEFSSEASFWKHMYSTMGGPGGFHVDGFLNFECLKGTLFVKEGSAGLGIWSRLRLSISSFLFMLMWSS